MKLSMVVLSKIVLLTLCAVGLTSCWVSHEAKIDCDKTVDDRLAGVWKMSKFTEAERKNLHEEDDGDIGWDYIIFVKVDEGRYKVIPLSETHELEEQSAMLEFEVGTKKHKGSDLMAASLSIATIKMLLREDGNGEEPDEKAIAASKKGFLIDYRFNANGQLFLSYIDGNLEEAVKVHSIKLRKGTDNFFPEISILGTQKQVLDFYTDPKVKKFFTSLGKYQKLTAPKQ